MLADYASSSDEESMKKEDIKPTPGVLKIGKADVEIEADVPVSQSQPKKQFYSSTPTVGLSSNLAKRKPETEGLPPMQQFSQVATYPGGTMTPLKTDITPEDIEVAKKKLVPSVIRTKKPNKPIEI